MNILHLKQGQSMLEVVLAITLLTLGIVAVSSMMFQAGNTMRSGLERMQASLIASEGIEVARMMGGGDFTNLLAGQYGIAFIDGQFLFVGQSDTEDQFTRTVAVVDISPSLKQVICSVSWDSFDIQKNSLQMVADLSSRG